MITKTYDDGQVILRQGDPADYFYIVIKGSVAVRRRGDDVVCSLCACISSLLRDAADELVVPCATACADLHLLSLHLKALVFLYAFEESVDCHLLSSFCDDSNLHISLFKYVLSTMGASKESISKFLIGNRFHVKLRILSRYSNRFTQRRSDCRNSPARCTFRLTNIFPSLVPCREFTVNSAASTCWDIGWASCLSLI